MGRTWAVSMRWLGWGLIAAFGGCVGGDDDPEQRGLLLLDAEAVEAGFAISGDSIDPRTLPVAPDADGFVTVVGPDGARRIDVAPSELVRIRGPEGTIERLSIGDDVHANGMTVRATADVSEALAEELGAAVQPREGAEGLFDLEAPGLLGAAALLPSLETVVEVEPVAVDGEDAPLIPRLPPRAWPARRIVPQAAPGGTAAAAAALAIGSQPAWTPLTVSPQELQYADLPPAVSCEDPVEGTWIGRRYYPGYGDWYLYTAKIRRTPGNTTALRGEVLAHSWFGSETDKTPSCDPAGEQWIVRMPARGTVRDGHVRFEGTRFGMQELMCGSAPTVDSYCLDRFNGPVAGSVEGATWINEDGCRGAAPIDFRRISCEAR